MFKIMYNNKGSNCIKNTSTGKGIVDGFFLGNIKVVFTIGNENGWTYYRVRIKF